jgi:hypothetical protein
MNEMFEMMKREEVCQWSVVLQNIQKINV